MTIDLGKKARESQQKEMLMAVLGDGIMFMSSLMTWLASGGESDFATCVAVTTQKAAEFGSILSQQEQGVAVETEETKTR
jgi:hypothetical protein